MSGIITSNTIILGCSLCHIRNASAPDAAVIRFVYPARRKIESSILQYITVIINQQYFVICHKQISPTYLYLHYNAKEVGCLFCV